MQREYCVWFKNKEDIRIHENKFRFTYKLPAEQLLEFWRGYSIVEKVGIVEVVF